VIRPGKLADFSIVAGDFYAALVSDLWRTRVKTTQVERKIVFGE
jgi:predicted amidohydrolase YtcJ